MLFCCTGVALGANVATGVVVDCRTKVDGATTTGGAMVSKMGGARVGNATVCVI